MKKAQLQKRKYSNIKQLDIENISNWGDKELHYLMETFTELENLLLDGQLTTSKSINTPTMEAFINFLLTIRNTSIDFGGLSDAKWLMNMYPIYINDTATNQKINCELSVSIRLQNHDSNSLLEQKMLQYGPPIKSEIDYVYDMDRDPARCRSAILDHLSHIHKNVQRVELDCDQHQIETEYITTLLGSNHSNIKGLKIVDGVQQSTHNITRLKFEETEIASKRVLPQLSKDFPYLEYLKFKSCKFEKSKKIINVFMESTDVGTLQIKSYDWEQKINGSLILVSVVLQDQKISKYYMNVTSKPHTEINETEEDSEDGDTDMDIAHGDDGQYNAADEYVQQEVVQISKMVFEHLKKTVKSQNKTVVSVRLRPWTSWY